MEISKEEIKRVKENMRRQKEYDKKFSQLPEVKEQSLIFKSWITLSTFGYAEVKDNVGYVWCPIHKRLEKVTLECGLEVSKAIELLTEEICKHAEEVKKAREKAGLKLDLIPYTETNNKEAR